MRRARTAAGLAALAGVFALVMTLRDDRLESPHGTVVLPPAPLPTVAVTVMAAAALPEHGPRLLETQSADEEDPGSATFAFADGTIRRIAVGGWIDPRARLASVADESIELETGGRRVTLPIERPDPAATGDRSGLPGIDVNARPGTANPKMARRDP